MSVRSSTKFGVDSKHAVEFARRVQHLLMGGNFEIAHTVIDEAELSIQNMPNTPLNLTPLAQTQLPERIVNALDRVGIILIGHLAGIDEQHILSKIPGCGPKAVEQIREVLVAEIARRRGK